MNPDYIRSLSDFIRWQEQNRPTLAYIEQIVHSPQWTTLQSLSSLIQSNIEHVQQITRHGFVDEIRRMTMQAQSAARQLASIDASFLKQAQAQHDFAQRLNSQLKYQFQSPAVMSYLDAIQRSNYSSDSFLSKLTSKLGDLADDPELDSQFATMDDLNEAISEKTQSLPAGLISFEGALEIVLALIGLFFAVFTYRESKLDSANQQKAMQALDRQIGEIAELQRQLLPKLTLLLPDSPQGTFYFVERRTQVYKHPTFKSELLGAIYPNQKVYLVERSHKWIRIQYFDFLQGQLNNGWVCKKYLSLIGR